MKRLLLVLCLALASGCASAPASLSPTAQADYKKTQVIKVLDLLRDAAIAANGQTPPLLSTATTRKVVEVHKTALLTIQGSDTGWAAAVGAALAQLSRDPTWLPSEAQKFAPYFTVAAQVIQQVQS